MAQWLGGAAAMKADPTIAMLQQEGLDVGHLAKNAAWAPFDNPKVRKGLNTAIDRMAINDMVSQAPSSRG